MKPKGNYSQSLSRDVAKTFRFELNFNEKSKEKAEYTQVCEQFSLDFSSKFSQIGNICLKGRAVTPKDDIPNDDPSQDPGREPGEPPNPNPTDKGRSKDDVSALQIKNTN